MARDPNIRDAFDVYTLVLLRRPVDAPQMPEPELDEARRLSDLDPSVMAGRLAYDLFEWWVAEGTLAFPGVAGAVGERRVMPDD